VVQDWKGNVCEISDRFDVTYLRFPKDFVTRRWLRCPVETREDWERMKERYRVDSPGRFPADFAARCAQARGRDWPLVVSFSGPFWQLREWCGFENLCIFMIEQPEWVDEMAAFWTAFASEVLARLLRHVAPDMIHLSEDMAYKAHPMISPAMTRRFCQPSYDTWVGQARAAGVPLAGVDSDGYVADLLPIWIESGINVCDPVEVAAHNDLPAYRRRFGRDGLPGRRRQAGDGRRRRDGPGGTGTPGAGRPRRRVHPRLRPRRPARRLVAELRRLRAVARQNDGVAVTSSRGSARCLVTWRCL
jgi:hypothetical protein